MGLADIRTVAIMTTVNRSTASAAAGASVSQVPGGGGVRKKRTFDIAFLTGQEEREERSGGGGGGSSTVSTTLSTALITSSRVSGIGHGELGLPPRATPPMDESTSNSSTSSIDVMTNGSLSESELNLSPCHAPSSTITPSPTEVVITSSLSSSTSPGSPPTVLRHRLTTTSNSSELPSQKTRKNNHREEIRFESKRTIDINQTSDSLKIKENLQFSSSLPTSLPTAMAPVVGGPVGAAAAAELVKSLPFALLPQIANFPAVHLPSHFVPGKMDKSDSLNIISYPGIGSTHGKLSRQSQALFQDPYNLNVQIGPSGGYAYPQNLMLPHDLNRSANYTSGPGHTPAHPITSQHQVHHGPTSPQISSAAAAAAAVAAAATLLPPSLTALTLPAQNVCAKCNIGFRMTSDLVYHMRSHHKRDSDPMKKKREEKLKCPVCHESFRERHHLTRHMTAHQDRAEEEEEKLQLQQQHQQQQQKQH